MAVVAGSIRPPRNVQQRLTSIPVVQTCIRPVSRLLDRVPPSCVEPQPFDVASRHICDFSLFRAAIGTMSVSWVCRSRPSHGGGGRTLNRAGAHPCERPDTRAVPAQMLGVRSVRDVQKMSDATRRRLPEALRGEELTHLNRHGRKPRVGRDDQARPSRSSPHRRSGVVADCSTSGAEHTRGVTWDGGMPATQRTTGCAKLRAAR